MSFFFALDLSCCTHFVLFLLNSNSYDTEDLQQDLDVKMDRKNFQIMSTEEKVKEQNRIRQLAFKDREKMPKDYKSFVLVAAHLIKNAHRYYSSEEMGGVKGVLDCYSAIGCVLSEENSELSEDVCKHVNKKLREIRTLKRQNRIREQQELVVKLKQQYGTYRSLSSAAGVALKTIHCWCSEPKERKHKATSRAELRKEEFTNFLMQDTITYSHPCQKYAGKKFLLHTWEEIYKRYEKQQEFHKHGLISKTTMRVYKPKYILLSGSTPVNQCLCDICENCDLIRKALVATGIRNVPPNKYLCLDVSFCEIRQGKFGTTSLFPKKNCITRSCEECGVWKLRKELEENNKELLQLNRRTSWHKWKNVDSFSVPQKCEIKGTLKAAVNEFLVIVEEISNHLFRANWHQNVFQYIRGHLQRGYILQVMDFAMNFRNWYQDEVQSAYYNGTQTTVHGTVNFFKCQTEKCQEIVTLSLVHISADLKHDSFLSRAAMNMTFKYLVEISIPLHLVIQFCDNCAAQYKSRRPFVEITRCAIELIRVYFGEKHGKSHADGLFGRLKSWMSYKIRSRHFIVKSAYDFFKFCREHYQTTTIKGACQHFRVEFEFVRLSDVRRHQDSDLDKAVDGTHEIYSVRNTPEELTLKVRHVPCLCPPCIEDNGEECLNSSHTDPWRTVKLIPERGARLQKYKKRKRPDAHIQQNPQEIPSVQGQGEPEGEISYTDPQSSEEELADEELPDIVFEDTRKKRKQKKNQKKEVEVEKSKINKKNARKKSEAVPVTDATNSEEAGVTDRVTDRNDKTARNEDRYRCSWLHAYEDITPPDEDTTLTGIFRPYQDSQESTDIEIIDVIERNSKEFSMAGENAFSTPEIETVSVEELMNARIPTSVLWPSILSAIEGCIDFNQAEKLAKELYDKMPPIGPRVRAVFSTSDVNDNVAQKEIPFDGPTQMKAVYTIGDGNCLCRALS